LDGTTNVLSVCSGAADNIQVVPVFNAANWTHPDFDGEPVVLHHTGLCLNTSGFQMTVE